MNSEIYKWLIETEEVLTKMIQGMCWTMTVLLWKWLYHFIVDTLGPLTDRLASVVGLGFLWLVMVFGPLYIGLAWWLKLGWLGISIGGSMWGLCCIVKKPKVTGEAMTEKRE